MTTAKIINGDCLIEMKIKLAIGITA